MMELLNKNKEWFLAAEGEKVFFALSSLEERTIFFYSYLKSAVNECFQNNTILSKIAFFFADAVYSSDKPYHQYPAILKSESNPFLYYLENADRFYDNTIMYMIFTAILQKKVDVANGNEWIYDNDFLSSEELVSNLSDKEMGFLPANSIDMVNPEIYKTEKADNFLQLALVWTFLK